MSTDQLCPECYGFCKMHNIQHCAICHKHPGECHFGSCTDPAYHAYILTDPTTNTVRDFGLCCCAHQDIMQQTRSHTGYIFEWTTPAVVDALSPIVLPPAYAQNGHQWTRNGIRCAGPDDTSEEVTNAVIFEPSCTSCWNGIRHTLDEHNRSIQENTL